MITKTTALRRLAAGVGAIALALVGVGAFSTAASADQPADGVAPGNAPANSTGTLTIHKFAGSPTSTTPPNGTNQGAISRPPLANANFVYCLLNSLATEADWTAAKNADASTAVCPGGIWTPMTPTSSAGITSASLLMGAYIVKEVAPFPTGVSSGPAFIVTIPYPSPSSTLPTTTTWLWSVHTYPKNTLTPGGGKTVADPTAHGLGTTVPWTITSRALGSFNDGAPLTSYKLIDKLVSQLQYEATQSLQYQAPNGSWTDVPNTPAFYTVTPASPATTGGGEAVVEFTPAGVTWLNTLQAGTKLQWKLSTKVVGVGSLENKAYENTGGDDVLTGTATSQWGQATLKKHQAGDEAKVLQGAEFKVYNSTDGACTTLGSQVSVTIGSVTKSVFESDPNGIVDIAGLWVGNDGATASRVYCVVETKAPAGYVLPTAPANVTSVTVAPGAAATATFPVKVANNPAQGPNLPLTGSTGTAAMSIGGLALVILGSAAIVLARRNRREHADQ